MGASTQSESFAGSAAGSGVVSGFNTTDRCTLTRRASANRSRSAGGTVRYPASPVISVPWPPTTRSHPHDGMVSRPHLASCMFRSTRRRSCGGRRGGRQPPHRCSAQTSGTAQPAWNGLPRAHRICGSDQPACAPSIIANSSPPVSSSPTRSAISATARTPPAPRCAAFDVTALIAALRTPPTG